MAKPLTAKLLREAAGNLSGYGGSKYFMCHAYAKAGGKREDLVDLLKQAVGPVEKSWYALPMPDGASCYDKSSLAWRFDLFNILAEYLDAEQSELATPRGSA